MAHKIECYATQPRPAADGVEPLPADVAVLLGTPVGSTVFQNRETLGGDTGVRAEGLATALGTTVIAWQDLGPKTSFPGLLRARHHITPQHFPEYAEESAATLRDMLEAREMGRVILRVHSGTGPLGTQLAINLHQQPDLVVSHLAISDPVGMRRVSFLEGLRRWHAYPGIGRNTPEDHRNELGHPSNTFRSFLGDVVVRGTTVWLTDTTWRNLIEIGNGQETAVRLHLPGNTLTGTPLETELAAAALKSQIPRAQVPEEAGSTFVIEHAPTHYHSSAYDSSRRNADFTARTIALRPFYS
jgi:hypothetical protein